MLGSFRLLLAAMMLCFHLAQGRAPVAAWCFFTVASLALSDQMRDIDLLMLSVLPILLIAYVLAFLADHFIEPLRDRVRLKEAP